MLLVVTNSEAFILIINQTEIIKKSISAERVHSVESALLCFPRSVLRMNLYGIIGRQFHCVKE